MGSHSQLGKHAIVLGGGIAGLLTARVLTEHFGRVSLVERDRYPEDPVFRPGVPQGRHVHFLLARGQQIIEELFPGIQHDLVAKGAIAGDWMKDFCIRSPFGWFPRLPSPLRAYATTRVLLEWQIRQALVKNPQIHIVDGNEAVNLIASEDGQSIVGVSLRPRPHAGGQGPRPVPTGQTQVAADLVVDATGRDSKAPQWLESLGYTPPSETIINPYLGYATQLYAIPPDSRRDWIGVVIHAEPPRNLRFGTLLPTNEGHWMVSLTGAGKEYPPTDDDAFPEFARGLSDPFLFELIKEAQPLSPIYSHRKTENRIRHFECLQRQPERFLIIGDSLCALDPIYAQGMTLSALGAMELRECLRQCGPDDLSGLARRFQHKLARVNAFPWRAATAVDMLIPGVEGERVKWTAKITSYYIRRLNQQTTTDPFLASLFFQVMQMVEPPTTLFKPSIVMRVLLNKRRNNVLSQEKS